MNWCKRFCRPLRNHSATWPHCRYFNNLGPNPDRTKREIGTQLAPDFSDAGKGRVNGGGGLAVVGLALLERGHGALATTIYATPMRHSSLMPMWTSSRFLSASGTRARQLLLRSTLTCLRRPTPRPPPLSMRPYADTRKGANWVPISWSVL